MEKTTGRIWIIILMIFSLTLFLYTDSSADERLSFPEITETICDWDGEGNLISETAHDINGNPAINSRGFHKAVYTWDSYGNLLTETYFGLNGGMTVTDKGYARVEYTYLVDQNGDSHIISEDRYDANGKRADIPGEYSYRRDEWSNYDILSTKYFNAQGELTRPNGGYSQILYSVDISDGIKTITTEI